MEKFNNWSILVDLDNEHSSLVAQIGILANRFVPKKINFICLENKEDLPKELLADLPDLVETTRKEKLSTFERLVTSTIHADHDVIFVHQMNKRIGQVLKRIGERSTDLLILKRQERSRLTNLYQRVARKTSASVLVFNQADNLDWNRLTLPIDLSIYSDLAINIANELTTENSQLNYIHAYQDSSRYLNQVFETASEVQDAMSRASLVNKKLGDYARSKVKDYLNTQSKYFGITQIVEYGRDKSTAQVLKHTLKGTLSQLVIMGSKGTGKSLASLMGNTADEFLKEDDDFSLLIVKQKGENQGFLSSFIP